MARTVPNSRFAELQQTSFGPFAKGAIDTANALLDLRSALKDAKNLRVVGQSQVLLRNGTTPVMTFVDDQGTPANVTSICGLSEFKDRALVVAHSTVTSKAYAYIVAADFSGWYAADDTFTTGTTASPTVVLWTSMSTAPATVTIAEGLGIAFIAHADAADANGLNWPTYRVGYNIDSVNTWTAQTLQSDLNQDSTAETLYFAGVIAFQQHLWAWGFGAGTTPATGYNPSRARFSNIIFGFNDAPTVQRDFFDSQDDMDLGNRTGSVRERIIAAAVGGPTLFLFGHETVSRVQGYGRDSWNKTVVDTTYGIVGPRAVVSTGDTVYYWTNRGPARLSGYVWYGSEGRPEPMWDAINAASLSALQGGNPATIVAGFARDLDQVHWYYQASASEGLVRFAAYDIRRDIWLGPDSAIGTPIACAGAIEPIYTGTSLPSAPAGPPTLTAATMVGGTQATANWTTGDPTAQTEVSIELHTGGSWAIAATVDAGILTYTFTGLAQSTGYDVRVRHLKNGQYSTYSTDTTPYFTTSPPNCLDPSNLILTPYLAPRHRTDPTGLLTWTVNQMGSQTVVLVKGPSDGSYGTLAYVAAGTASYQIGPVSSTGTYSFKIQSIQSGYGNSNLVGPVSGTLFAYSGP